MDDTNKATDQQDGGTSTANDTSGAMHDQLNSPTSTTGTTTKAAQETGTDQPAVDSGFKAFSQHADDPDKPADAGEATAADLGKVQDQGNDAEDTADAKDPMAPFEPDGNHPLQANVTGVHTGNGAIVGNETVRSFIPTTDSAKIGGDGITGRSNDLDTATDGATGDTNVPGDPATGTTPAAPRATTADNLVSTIASPASVEAAVKDVLGVFRTKNNGADFGATHNIFDDLGLHRSELPTLTRALNDKFGTTLSHSEAQNFLLVRDVWNAMKRKLAVKHAIAA